MLEKQLLGESILKRPQALAVQAVLLPSEGHVSEQSGLLGHPVCGWTAVALLAAHTGQFQHQEPS